MNNHIKKLSVIALTLLVTNSFAMADPADVKKFKETNMCRGCNLSGYNSDVFGDDHSYADLAGANLSRSILRGDYRKVNFESIIGIETTFNCDLTGANFSNARLVNANLQSRNLTDANFTGADVRNADFRECNLINAKITTEQLSTASSVCNALLPDGTKGKCK